MAKTPRVRDIGVDPDLLAAQAEVESLRAELEFAEGSRDSAWREVESLREQLGIFREDAEEARKVRGVLSLAAPAGYAVAHVKRLQADLEAAEAKLAEAEKLAQGRAESFNRCQELRGLCEDEVRVLEAKVKRVEKERDKWSDHWETEHEQLLALRASMDRARELAEKVRDERTNGATANSELIDRWLDSLARLLSGDEKRPNPAHPDWFPPDGTGKAE